MMFLPNFFRLWSASMLLFLLMGEAPSDAQSKPTTSVMVYQGWG
jgi:hypothetical protein